MPAGLRTSKLKQLLTIMVMTAVVMTAYEYVTHLILPDLTFWGSHIVTTIFVTIAATTTSFFLIRKYEENSNRLSREIAERKQVEETLRKNETFLDTIIETEPECVKLLDADGKLIRMNRAGLDMLEVDSLEQARNRSVFPLIDPEYRRAFVDLTREVFRGNTGSLKFRMTGVMGRQLWLDTHAVPLRNENNEIVALLGITRDVTEHQKADEALKQSESFIKNILETVGEGLIVLSPDFKIMSANRSYCESVRRSREEIIGRHCYEISHHITRPCYEVGEDCPTRLSFDTGEPQKAFHTHRDREGNFIYAEINSYPMKDPEGKITAVIETVKDITSQRMLEDQLRQAQKLEAVGQLAGGVAHDFNNILTAIIGYSSLLQMKLGENDTLRHDIEQILASAGRAANLTRSLLTYSRKQPNNPCAMDINETIQNMKGLLSRLIHEDIELKVLPSQGGLFVMADSSQIEQVLMNMAVNATDAMPDGGIFTIETGTFDTADGSMDNPDFMPGKYALISLTDTGIGMDEKTRERIFEPFFTTKEVGKGTGLGLAMVYGIVTQHHGYIRVLSDLGKGTTFRIYLPLITGHGNRPETIEKDTIMRRGTGTIMIAEDDESVRSMINTMLSAFGFSTIEAVDGEDAVAKFIENSERISLVILDVIMPKLGGRDVYESIRKIKPGIMVLFTSGYAAEVIHAKGLVEEGLHFISKPVSPSELLKKIGELLDCQQAG